MCACSDLHPRDIPCSQWDEYDWWMNDPREIQEEHANQERSRHDIHTPWRDKT